VRQALEAAERLLVTHRGVLVQGPVPGVKATYNVCLHRGKLLAESMALAIHEAPHSGGLTVLRRTWWHDGIREDALRRLEAMRWDGVAMMEYKWDEASRQFGFIEANTRFWAALHLDLFAGADFPRIQVEAFLGQAQGEVVRPTREVTCRYTVPGDTSWLLSSLRDPAVPATRKLSRLLRFAAMFLDPRVESDLLFPGDRKLYWLEWQRFLRDLGKPASGH
jgi:predicted ATP-grasp superfamily ATP-dependent carboligase